MGFARGLLLTVSLLSGEAARADPLDVLVKAYPDALSERDAQRFYAIARGSALECATILDAFGALGFVQDTDLTVPLELLERIVSMLTRMARG